MSDITELSDIRAKIDDVNKGLIDLLAERKDLVAEVAKIKAKYGLEAHQPDRFRDMMVGLQKYADSQGLDKELVAGIFDVIHRQSIAMQHKHI